MLLLLPRLTEEGSTCPRRKCADCGEVLLLLLLLTEHTVAGQTRTMSLREREGRPGRGSVVPSFPRVLAVDYRKGVL